MAFQKDRDYAAEIVRAIQERAPKETVGQLLTERGEKIAADRDRYASIGISQDDAYASMARAYLRQSDSGPALRPSDSGTALRPSDSGTALRQSDSGAPLRRSDSGGALRPSDSGPALRQSDSGAALPSVSRSRETDRLSDAADLSTPQGRDLYARTAGSFDPSPRRADPSIDLSGMTGRLRDTFEIERQRSDASIDRATAQAVDAASQALQDAQSRYGDQMAQIELDEARARDAHALYAELRGDRGGIGAAQYDSISNAAARQRRAVQDARVQMAADTQRQIARLRAQGAYEKADKALALTQQYLSKLTDLEKWGAEYRMKEDQFQAGLDQWLANYRMQLRKMEISQEQWRDEADYKRWRADVSDQQWALSRQDSLSQKAIDNAYREQVRQDSVSQKTIDNAYREQTRRDRLERQRISGAE